MCKVCKLAVIGLVLCISGCISVCAGASGAHSNHAGDDRTIATGAIAGNVPVHVLRPNDPMSDDECEDRFNTAMLRATTDANARIDHTGTFFYVFFMGTGYDA